MLKTGSSQIATEGHPQSTPVDAQAGGRRREWPDLRGSAGDRRGSPGRSPAADQGHCKALIGRCPAERDSEVIGESGPPSRFRPRADWVVTSHCLFLPIWFPTDKITTTYRPLVTKLVTWPTKTALRMMYGRPFCLVAGAVVAGAVSSLRTSRTVAAIPSGPCPTSRLTAGGAYPDWGGHRTVEWGPSSMSGPW